LSGADETDRRAAPQDLLAPLRRFGRRFAGLGRRRAPYPVLLVSPLWRCGSTWLQRMLIATGEVYLWGEPFHATHRLRELRLAQADLDIYAERAPRDPLAVLREFRPGYQAPPERWLASSRSMLRAVYAPPDGSSARFWGFKDVHLDVEDLEWWRRLFPDLKVILLTREPGDAYRSYAAAQRGQVSSGWKQPPPWDEVVGPEAWSELWLARAPALLDWAGRHGGLPVRYEEALADPAATLKAVAAYIGLPELTDRRVGAAVAVAKARLGEANPHRWPVPQAEVEQVRRRCAMPVRA
jgi:hypothetical protein